MERYVGFQIICTKLEQLDLTINMATIKTAERSMCYWKPCENMRKPSWYLCSQSCDEIPPAGDFFCWVRELDNCLWLVWKMMMRGTSIKALTELLMYILCSLLLFFTWIQILLCLGFLLLNFLAGIVRHHNRMNEMKRDTHCCKYQDFGTNLLQTHLSA